MLKQPHGRTVPAEPLHRPMTLTRAYPLVLLKAVVWRQGCSEWARRGHGDTGQGSGTGLRCTESPLKSKGGGPASVSLC